MCLRKLKMYSTRLFIFALFGVSSVICEKYLCDVDDNKCLTEGAARTFERFVSGMPGVEPSDPLHLDEFEGNLPLLKYKLTNATLSGMKDCHVEFVQISKQDKKFHYHVGCPFLFFESRYETTGQVGPEIVKGDGTCRLFFFDYNFLFNGDYERKDCNDKKTHIQLKNTNLEIEAKGKVHFDFENLYNGNKAKSNAFHKFANENWHYVEKLIRQPGMEAFRKKYINNVNAFLRKVSLEELSDGEYSRPLSVLNLN